MQNWLSHRGWQQIGWLGVVALIVLELTPPPALMTDSVEWSDKFYHAVAYGSLTWWFALGYARTRWAAIAVGFAVLGLVLEGLQALTPERVASLADELANSCGVLLGLIAASQTPAGFPPFRHAEYSPL